MAGFSSLLLAGGLALGAAGLGMQYMGMQKQAAAQKSAFAAQMAAEGTRKAAMELDAQRRTREAVRQSIVMRGAALNQSANEGSQYGSGLAGIEGGIANQAAYNVAGIQGQKQLGIQLSDQNMIASKAGLKASEGGTMAAMGGGVSSLGGMLLNNIGTFSRLGTNYGF